MFAPALYQAPWSFGSLSAEAAARQLAAQLRAQVLTFPRAARDPVIEVEGPNRGGGSVYWVVKAEVPSLDPSSGKSAPTSGRMDILEAQIFSAGTVLFRSVGSEEGDQWPPFCTSFGCINGPPVRERLQALRKKLGWELDEPEQVGNGDGWVPIFFH